MVTCSAPANPPFFRKTNYLTIFGLMMILGVLSIGMSPSYSVTYTITLDTNKSSYGPGDLVELKGNLQNLPDKLVAIQVKDPSGNTIVIRTVQTDAHGNFVLKFKIPQTAKSGNYDIIANAKVNGDIAKGDKTITSASVVPEFPLNVGTIMTLVIALTTGIARFGICNRQA